MEMEVQTIKLKHTSIHREDRIEIMQNSLNKQFNIYLTKKYVYKFINHSIWIQIFAIW